MYDGRRGGHRGVLVDGVKVGHRGYKGFYRDVKAMSEREAGGWTPRTLEVDRGRV